MYAIFESGGKQHRAVPGEVLTLERLDGDAGAKLTFDKVLLVTTDQGTEVGAPHVAGAVVQATVLDQTRGRKIFVFKKKRRKKFRRRQGHRQSLTRVMIDTIGGVKGGAKAKAAAGQAPARKASGKQAPAGKTAAAAGEEG